MLRKFLIENKLNIFLISICVLVVIKNSTLNQSYTHSENESVENEITSLDENQEEVKDIENEVNKIVVDIKGEVRNPGVYEMEEGDRVSDLIKKAGGMTHENTKCVNLAKKLIDEEVIVIPEKDTLCENVENSTQNDDGDSDKVNINSADLSELQTLNGIGQTRAQDIIDYREQNGNFKSVEDLKNVSGIGDTTYEKLKDSITV